MWGKLESNEFLQIWTHGDIPRCLPKLEMLGFQVRVSQVRVALRLLTHKGSFMSLTTHGTHCAWGDVTS